MRAKCPRTETNQVSVMTHQIDAKANQIDTKADQINTKADQIDTNADQINTKADLSHMMSDRGDDAGGVVSSARDLLPLRRMALPPEKPTGRKLEEVKSALLRMHRAAGHSSMESLARLLEKRGAARWASELARSLKCDDCEESRRISPVPPASTEEQPSLWETLGLDVFEYEYEAGGTKMKAKFLLFQDRASRYCMTKLLKTYPAAENWEPTTGEVKSALVTGWLATNPAPVWIITDSAPYFVSTEMADFCSRSGIGLMTAPAEAHWLVGQEERKIQTLKRTAARLEKESLGLSIEEIFALAVHGANSSLNASGFTPFQWTHGWQRDEIESLPDGINPKRAFSRMLAFREKARAAFVKSDAAEKLSRLNNAVQRKAVQYQESSWRTCDALEAKNPPRKRRLDWAASGAVAGRINSVACNGRDNHTGQDEPGPTLFQERGNCALYQGHVSDQESRDYVHSSSWLHWAPLRRRLAGDSGTSPGRGRDPC